MAVTLMNELLLTYGCGKVDVGAGGEHGRWACGRVWPWKVGHHCSNCGAMLFSTAWYCVCSCEAPSALPSQPW